MPDETILQPNVQPFAAPRRSGIEAFGDSVKDAYNLNWPGQLVEAVMAKDWEVDGPTEYNVFKEEDFSNIPQDFWDHFSGSRSPHEFQSRMKWLQRNLDRRARLQDGGNKVGAFLGGVLDPINLIPLPALGASSMLKGMVRGASLVTSVNSLGEFMRIGLDPTAEPEEMMYTLGYGAIFGAVLGAATSRLTQPSWWDQRYERGIIARHKAMFHMDESAMQASPAGSSELIRRLSRELHLTERTKMQIQAEGLEGYQTRKPWLILSERQARLSRQIQDLERQNPSGKLEPWQPGGRPTPMSPDVDGNVPMTTTIENAETPFINEQTNLLDHFRDTAMRIDNDASTLSKTIKDRMAKIDGAKTEKWAERYRTGDYGKGHRPLEDMQKEMAGLDARRLDADLRGDRIQVLLNSGPDALRLMPTGIGLEQALAASKQFPLHATLETSLLKELPTVGKAWQMATLDLAGTPGLMLRGSQEGISTGPSIEMMTKQYTRLYAGAQRNMMQQYSRMRGLGDDAPSDFNIAARDTGQRIAGVFSRTKARMMRQPLKEGPLDINTIAGFEDAVGRTMLGEAPANEFVAAGAKVWQDEFYRPFAEILDELDMLPNTKSIKKQLALKTARRNTLKKGVERDNLDVAIVELEDQLDTVLANPSVGDRPFGHFPRVYKRFALDEPGMDDWFRGVLRKHLVGRSWIYIGDRKVMIRGDSPQLEAVIDEIVLNVRREITFGDGIGTMRGMTRKQALEARLESVRSKMGDPSHTPDQVSQALARTEILEDAIKNAPDATGGGAPSFMLSRQLDFLPSKDLVPILETSATRVSGHYMHRLAPLIETSRKFGDIRGQGFIDKLYDDSLNAIDGLPKPRQAAALKELDRVRDNWITMRDVVQGNHGIPDDPSAWTEQLSKGALGWTAMTWMGRSAQSAMIDAGLMQTTAGFKPLMKHFSSYFVKDDFLKLMRHEGELAGMIKETMLSARIQAVAEAGGGMMGMSRATAAINRMASRFFFLNGLAPWTDFAKGISSGLAQSEMMRVSLNWADISAVKKGQFAKLGLTKRTAAAFAREWKAAGSHQQVRGKSTLYLANTGNWKNQEAVRLFRAIMAAEVDNVVITPGAASKPLFFISGPMGRIIGQFRGFGMDATQKVLMSSLQTRDKTAVSAIASMIGLGMVVDWMRRPDFIDLSPDEQILRGIELGGVMGIFTDMNMIAEQLSGDTFGVRPMLGMDPVIEADDNWARQFGSVLGAAPQTSLNLIWAFTSPNADRSEKARAIRFLWPYQNHIALQSMNREIERSLLEGIEFVSEDQPQ